MNPIGVNSWVFVSPPTDAAIASIAPRVKAMGFDVLELGIEAPGQWDPQRTGEVLAEHGLGTSVCAAMGPDRDFIDPALLAGTQEYVRYCIDAVANAGGSVVAGPLYSPVGKTWQMTPAERSEALDRLVEGLTPVADYAAARGVRLAIEPLNRFETSFFNTTAQVREVVDRMDHPAVGILLDTFHMNIEEKDPAAAIRLAGDSQADPIYGDRLAVLQVGAEAHRLDRQPRPGAVVNDVLHSADGLHNAGEHQIPLERRAVTRISAPNG